RRRFSRNDDRTVPHARPHRTVDRGGRGKAPVGDDGMSVLVGLVMTVLLSPSTMRRGQSFAPTGRGIEWGTSGPRAESPAPRALPSPPRALPWAGFLRPLQGRDRGAPGVVQPSPSAAAWAEFVRAITGGDSLTAARDRSADSERGGSSVSDRSAQATAKND